ncbi:hypothetical protein [Papillibacter cinnamivorans]|uniref:Uncharacterized protein n=1 Tax=Papillibacter cinnamivorans DSM 12816 TaxID=1122930 RepID=A0A1W2ASI9_9FIRM|nr:hypothetical protein [Papillibacter cinnamivorans]SMC63677.1 hypothetical protein SAMN02745168_1933 [Papillibacter cinnamivorans DSM 12816]
MRNIWIGMILIFLDFNLNIGSSQIGLIPDFLGYIILINGLSEMNRESPQFGRVKPFAIGMAIYTAILYVMDFLGISAALGGFPYLLGVVSTLVSLYISYHIVTGVREIEETRGTFMNGDALKTAWNRLAVFSVIALFAVWIPFLALFILIAGFIVSILYLVAFNTAKKLYYEPAARL